MSSWPLLVFTTLGAGAAGAIITTYGTQSRDRRSAWAEVRLRVARAEYLAREASTSREEMMRALAEVEQAAFTAAVPWHVVAIYRSARIADFDAVMEQRSDPYNRRDAHSIDARISGRAAFRACEMLIRTLWHPWLTMPTRRIRSRRIRRFLYCGLPPGAVIGWRDERAARRWERKTIRNRQQSR